LPLDFDEDEGESSEEDDVDIPNLVNGKQAQKLS